MGVSLRSEVRAALKFREGLEAFDEIWDVYASDPGLLRDWWCSPGDRRRWERALRELRKPQRSVGEVVALRRAEAAKWARIAAKEREDQWAEGRRVAEERKWRERAEWRLPPGLWVLDGEETIRVLEDGRVVPAMMGEGF